MRLIIIISIIFIIREIICLKGNIYVWLEELKWNHMQLNK